MSYSSAFIVIVLFMAVNGQVFKSVTRRDGEPDTFMFSDDCFSCGTDAYQTSGSCNCKCQIGSAYSVTEKRCMRPNTRTDAIHIARVNRQGEHFGVHTLRTYFLKSSGYAMYYCENTNDCNYNSNGCKINLPGSIYDNFGWERIWLANEIPDFYIDNVAGVQMLKLAQDSKRYQGMLLKISMDCKDLNGNNINTFAMFAIEGTFTEKERVEDRFPNGVTTTQATTKILPPTKSVKTTILSSNGTSKNITGKGKISKEKDDGGSNAAGTAVAVLFVILFLLAVAVGVYLYYKWRQDKVAFVIRFNENKVVQYVQIKKSQLKQKIFHEKDDTYDTPTDFYIDSQSQLSIDVLPDVVSVAEKQSTTSLEKSNDNKFGTLRGLYATIDKFIHKKSKSSSSKKDRSFSAFPKELYNQPGVVFKIEKPKKPKRANVKSIVFRKAKSIDETTNKKEGRIFQARTRSSSLPPIPQNPPITRNMNGIKPRPISAALSSSIDYGYSNGPAFNDQYYVNTPTGSQDCLIYQNEIPPPLDETIVFQKNEKKTSSLGTRKRSSMAFSISESQLQTINENISTVNDNESIYKQPEAYITMHPAKKSDSEEPSSPPYAYADNVTTKEDDGKTEGYQYPKHISINEKEETGNEEDESYLVPHPENEEDSDPVYETPAYATCNDAVYGKDNEAFEYETPPGDDDPDYILPPHLSPPSSFSDNIFSNITLSIFQDSQEKT